MNIIETNIPDVSKSNINEQKQSIADNIIKNVYPLFDEVYQARLLQIAKTKKQLKKGKQQMKDEKETMEQLLISYKKEKKIAKVLERIDKLVKAGLTYDPTTKHETVILLKILDKLPSEKLDEQLTKTMQILNKRFS